ncbi:hypothetical protein ACF1BP_14455 [Streptomyces sp. NPDC014735]|uniref:hypothetical protein n=1 Tax=unclassified Streptomyces TaxID=2593676 RepID=UPI0036F72517
MGVIQGRGRHVAGGEQGVEAIGDTFQGACGGLLRAQGFTLCGCELLVQPDVPFLKAGDRLGHPVRQGVDDGGGGRGRFRRDSARTGERVRALSLDSDHDIDHPLLERPARGLRAAVDEVEQSPQIDEIHVSTPLPACGNAETVTSS